MISNALAGDSDWKLCKGEVVIFDRQTNIIVNVYEHRSTNGRKADITMIYGGNILKGSLDTTSQTNANMTLKGFKSSYKGNLGVDYSVSTMDLNGDLNIGESKSALQATLQCQTL